MVFEINRIGSGDEPAARKLLRVLASSGVWFYESTMNYPPRVRWEVGVSRGYPPLSGYADGELFQGGEVERAVDGRSHWLAVLDAVSDALRARDGYGTAALRSEEEWRGLVEGAMS